MGFLGSDLAVFSPKIRQLYATGDAANLVTMPDDPKPCTGSSSVNSANSPDMCAEQTANLAGERRALIFGTATNIGLKLGFTGNAPSSIKFGFNRGELSIIPLHHEAAANKLDKYTSVLASLNMNLDTPNVKNTGLQVTQFLAQVPPRETSRSTRTSARIFNKSRRARLIKRRLRTQGRYSETIKPI